MAQKNKKKWIASVKTVSTYPPPRPVYEDRGNHCKNFGFHVGVAERARFRDADAYIFHQPRRARAQQAAASRAGKGKIFALATHTSREQPAKERRLVGPLAARSPGLRLTFALEIKRHGSADEILRGRLIDLVALVDVDGAPDIPVEAGVE